MITHRPAVLQNCTRHASHALTFAVALALLASCNDDIFVDYDKPLYDNDIVFSVTDEDIACHSSRGNGYEGRYGGISALTDVDGDTLYLFAEQTPGIDVASITSAGSRGQAADASTLPGFGVYALFEDGNHYMSNVEVRNEGSYWAPVDRYSWPAEGSLTFYAYAPYTKTPADEGITALPYYNTRNEYVIDFTVPAKVEDQVDLIIDSIPVNASESPCQLVMKHKLTAIRFATGRRMPACTIKKIEIRGVAYKGSLCLEDNRWDINENETTDYVIDFCSADNENGLPLKGNDAAADGESNKYAKESVLITGNKDDNNTLLLMPQTLGDGAEISLTINWKDPDNAEAEAKDYTFTSSLKGKQWLAGTTLTYSLSANPGIPTLIFEVVDAKTGYALKTIRPGYAGGKKDYMVRSLLDPGNGSAPIPVPWTAELFQNGRPTTVEEFNEAHGNISSFTTSGLGGEEACNVITVLPNVNLDGGMSEHTRKLREAASVGSPDKPKNLADIRIYDSDPNKGPAGAPANTINTSNCYIVNAPGTYSIPLVYGNAIQSGREFSYSYDYKLNCLYNYVGNPIKSPYITLDTDEKYGKPKLIWSDQLNVISNVRLSENSNEQLKMIVFDVDPKNIRQCNAVVAITDTKGEVMWSWHIWVTDMTTTNSKDYIPMPCPDASAKVHHHYLFHTNIGHIYEGDVVEFKTPELTIKYSQDLTGLEIPGETKVAIHTITMQQESYKCEQNEYFLLYQFGRKDPFVPKIDRIYDGNNNVILTTNGRSGFPTFRTIDERVTTGNGHYFQIKHNECMAYSIKHPEQFMEGAIKYDNILKAEIHTHMWNISGTNREFGTGAGGSALIPYKSVYDPCPVGCKLPIGDWLKQITLTSTVANNKLTNLSVSWQTNHIGKRYTLFSYTYNGQNQEIFIYASGYKTPYGYWVDDAMSPMWYVWLGDGVDKSSGKAQAICGRIKSNGEPSVEIGPQTFTYAYGVRPMHVEDGSHHFYD